jgi:hypothetical protein
MGHRYGYLPYLSYRYGHPGYGYRIWANDMGDDSIDMVILYIDMGYLVTLLCGPHQITGNHFGAGGSCGATSQGAVLLKKRGFTM